MRDMEFEFKYDISSLFNEFNFINVSKFAQWLGLSPSLMRHYKSGDTYISAQQAKKIEDGLHSMARQLLTVTLQSDDSAVFACPLTNWLSAD